MANFFIHRKSLILISFMLLFAFSAWAEEPADIGEIHVEAGTEQESAEAPSSFVTVIKPEQEHASFENVSDLVAASPGVTSRSLSGLGQFSTVSIRGSSSEQVSVYLDGIKLNTASGGAFDFSTIPLDSIDRIEVIRGGGTAQFGSDAIGGVINIITKQATGTRTIEGIAGGGSFLTLKFGSSYRQRFEKNSIVLSWSHLSSKGDYTFKSNQTRLAGQVSSPGSDKTYTRIHNGFISESLLASWEHKFNDRFKLSILNDFFFTDREVPGTEAETIYLYPGNPLQAKENIFRNSNSIIFDDSRFFADPLRFSGGINTNFDLDHFKDPTPALGNPINTKTYDFALNPFLKWTAYFDSRILNQLITFRYDFRMEYLNDSSPIQGARLTGRRIRNINSVFLQDELSFLGDKILFNPSVRYEDASDFSGDIAFRTGLKLSPLKWLAIKANFERSFRYPSFDELYFPDQGYIRGNPNLEKEKAWNLDGGISLNTKWASLDVAYFRNWIDNMIIFVPISATTIMPMNTYLVDTQGVEVGLTANPVKYVGARVSYTYLDAHYTSMTNQLPGRPKHEIYARLDLNYDWSKRFGGTLFGVFDYKSAMPVNTSNTVFLAGRSQLDLGLNFKFLKKYYMLFEAKNITNVQIYDARGFPLPRRSFFATLGGRWS